MSTRLLRKVLKEQEEQQQQQQKHLKNGDDSDADSDPPADSPSLSFNNPFDLLSEQEHNQENESDIIDESSIASNEESILSRMETTTTKVASSNLKSKKKKNKKCKQSSSSTSSILQVDPRFLSAENELRRIFGSEVVDSFERTHQAGTSRQIRGVDSFERTHQAGTSRQIRGARRGSHSHRKTILVSHSDHWPRWDGSLSMELLENRDGYNCFKYVHSSTYSQAQRVFEDAKAAHDLKGIASILLRHPYHIDSLITLADYYRFSGELQMSTDATAKCVYALECAWHPMFNPMQGNCRLKYNHETNRPLFSTLLTHMKNMDGRCCHRSALEICKLLLSLDSDDPVGGLFCIDYFALRAEEYMWLERFSEEYKSDIPLWLYPNFSYSLAVCRFYLDREKASCDLMKRALMLHPSVLKKLVAKVPLNDQAWTKILNHSFFGSADKTGSPSWDHLINIYVERSYIIWRLPDLKNLLRYSAFLVIKELEESTSDASIWTYVRKQVFSSFTRVHINRSSSLTF